MKFLLDTSAFSELMRGETEIAHWLVSLYGDDRVVIRPVVRGEIQFGISRLGEGKQRAALEAAAHGLYASVACEPIPERAGDHNAAIKLARQRKGLSLDEHDLWIAATALALNATLVSRDQDFAGIDNLRVAQPA